MTIFALDASGRTGGVCVLQSGAPIYEKTIDEGLTHSQTLLALADEAFAATALRPAQVDLYAVTAGPGSFTGLRIGMAVVKGLALPFLTGVAGVSTLEAHARGADIEGIVLPALNARRGEVYWASFRRVGGALHRLTPDAAAPAETLVPEANGWEAPVHLIGDGAHICYNTFKGHVEAKVETGYSIARGAALAAQAMQARGEVCEAAQLRPQYLRLSQAERERAERLAQEQKK